MMARLELIRIVVVLVLVSTCLQGSVEAKPTGGFKKLLDFCAGSSTRAYQTINGYLVEHVREDASGEENMEALIKWLRDGRAISDELLAGLQQFSGLNSMQCGQSGMDTIVAIRRSIRGCSLDTSDKRLQRVERVLRHYRRKHANRCQAEFADLLEAKLTKPTGNEGLKMFYVQMLTMGAIESHRNKLDSSEAKRGAMRWLVKRDFFGPSLRAERYFDEMCLIQAKYVIDIPTSLDSDFLHSAVDYLSRHDSDNQLLKGKRDQLISLTATKDGRRMFNWYVREPCEYFVAELEPHMKYIKHDFELVNMIDSKEQFMRLFYLRFAKEAYTLCKHIVGGKLSVAKLFAFS